MRPLQRIDDLRILEHYVADLIAAGRRVRLIGAYSTSFITLKSSAIEKYYLHLVDNETYPGIMRSVGCSVFKLREQGDRESWRRLATRWRIEEG